MARVSAPCGAAGDARCAREHARALTRDASHFSLACSPTSSRFAADLKAAGERYPPAMMTNVYEAREQAKA